MSYQPDASPDFGREELADLATVAIGVPGITGNPYDYLVVMELPREADLQQLWHIYNQCGGRVNYSLGGRHAHKQAMFNDWLLKQFPRPDTRQLSMRSREKGGSVHELVEELAEIGVEPEIVFVPDFEELAPQLR